MSLIFTVCQTHLTVYQSKYIRTKYLYAHNYILIYAKRNGHICMVIRLIFMQRGAMFYIRFLFLVIKHPFYREKKINSQSLICFLAKQITFEESSRAFSWLRYFVSKRWRQPQFQKKTQNRNHGEQKVNETGD